jgi:hypothetical protein
VTFAAAAVAMSESGGDADVELRASIMPSPIRFAIVTREKRRR